ncbi:MAG: N-acetyl-gamma-glutamyl-phosphate reductase [Gammaproteobacteria bacterium]
MSSSPIRIGIVGASGYTGLELLRLLLGHPQADIAVVTSRGEAGQPVSAIFPHFDGLLDLAFSAPDPALLESCDLVFFTTPNATAMHMVPALLRAGVKVIDLSADFRLRDAAEWADWYGERHACPELLEQAVYGLPELNRDAIKTARLIANPGCYPTASILALQPLLQAGVVDSQRLIVDAKSGVSGAGRKASLGTQFCETAESFRAYSVAGHRHQPEIVQALENGNGRPGLTFVPHLVPMVRGIHATVYADLIAPATDVQALFEEHYSSEPFVHVMPAGSHPDTRSTRGSNLCRLAVHQPAPDRLVVLSVIDNLVKGAAGQALQNMNLMFGRPETTGLTSGPLVP